MRKPSRSEEEGLAPRGGLARALAGTVAAALAAALPIALAAVLAVTLIFPAAADAARPSKRRPPQRLAGQRIEVPIEGIEVHDGDTFSIDWGNGDRERIRLLGIDCPEIEGESPEILYDQPYAREATWFALGALATTQRAEILRASILDRYGRTLAYVFLDGTNYSVLALQAHLAYETIGEFGDQGLPEPAAACAAAARAAGTPPFENPAAFRARMREIARTSSPSKPKKGTGDGER